MATAMGDVWSRGNEIEARPSARRRPRGLLRGVGRRLVAGALLLFVVGALPAAIVVAADSSSCSWNGDSSAFCIAHNALPTPWFLRDQAEQVMAVAIVFAALVIPVGIGVLARSWWWLVISGATAEASVILGAFSGAVVARWWYPEFYAYGSGTNNAVGVALFGAAFAIVVAVAPACATAAIGTIVGMGVERWRARRTTRRPDVRW